MQTDFIIPQGATWTTIVAWKDSDGNAIDVTGYEAEMQLRANYSDCYAFLTLSTEASSITVDGPAGTFTLTATAATTSGLEATTYLYDLEVTSPEETVTRLLEGTVTVTPRVTQ